MEMDRRQKIEGVLKELLEEQGIYTDNLAQAPYDSEMEPVRGEFAADPYCELGWDSGNSIYLHFGVYDGETLTQVKDILRPLRFKFIKVMEEMLTEVFRRNGRGPVHLVTKLVYLTEEIDGTEGVEIIVSQLK